MPKAIQFKPLILTWVTIQDKVKLVEPLVKEDKMNKIMMKSMMMNIMTKKKIKKMNLIIQYTKIIININSSSSVLTQTIMSDHQKRN